MKMAARRGETQQAGVSKWVNQVILRRVCVCFIGSSRFGWGRRGVVENGANKGKKGNGTRGVSVLLSRDCVGVWVDQVVVRRVWCCV